MEEIKEIWKDIPEYEGFYQVSNWGRVKSVERIVVYCNGKTQLCKEKILNQTKKNNGYLSVMFSKNNTQKRFYTHRLVAECFLEPIEGKNIVNHKDENKENNHVDNLEFCTQQYNVTYNDAHIKRGRKRKGFKMCEEQKKKLSKAFKGKPQYKTRIPIVQLDLQGNFIKEWDSMTTTSKELNIHHSNISTCCKGKQKTCGGYKWVYKSDYKPTYTQLELNFD